MVGKAGGEAEEEEVGQGSEIQATCNEAKIRQQGRGKDFS